MDQYQSLVKTKRWIGNNPITLKAGSPIKDKDYYVTDKLDGIRRLLLFNGETLYNISSKLDFQEFYLTKGGKTLTETLIDCEYFKKKYYAFDLLFYSGKDCRETKNFTERQELLKKVVKAVGSKRLLLKDYKKLECPEVLKRIKDSSFKEGQLDGLIIVPNSAYKDTVFKWKPSNLLSNDFKVQKIPGFLLLLLQNGQVFKPKGYPDIGKVAYNGKEIDDDDVVEFIFENGKFKPLRTRPDKTKSNHITVILDNFKEMIRPTKPSSLFC